MKLLRLFGYAVGTVGLVASISAGTLPYVIVDTGQVRCYDNSREVAYTSAAERFYGQDAQFAGRAPSYRDNCDGTVSDLVTGLMWTRDPGAKKSYGNAVSGASACRIAKKTDWRLPTIKELYSLIKFNGVDPDPMRSSDSNQTPFIDISVFKFQYGDQKDGDRIIDSQFATSTKYVSTTMGGNETMFGVNFADGRIKGYPSLDRRHGGQKKFCVLYVRGNKAYGLNDFNDNGDGTITDVATGLTWTQSDSGKGMNWEDALNYAEDMKLAGYSDWRLPNAKELQSIVDYTRSPDITDSAAIDPMFKTTSIVNELNIKDYPAYWTGTTHVRAGGKASAAVYVAFGRAMGCMHGRWMDVHGAGCQRSDPKEGDPADYPKDRGPQGDAIRILNYVRCVRGGTADLRISGPTVEAPSVQKKKCVKRDMILPLAWRTSSNPIRNNVERPPVGSCDDWITMEMAKYPNRNLTVHHNISVISTVTAMDTYPKKKLLLDRHRVGKVDSI